MTHPNAYRREIDACRPGSNDLQLPELAGLAQAVASDPRTARDLDAAHAADVVLCDALQEVPVPSGLSDRLLAQLLAPRSVSLDAVSVASPEAPAVVAHAAKPAEPSVVGRSSRRAWLIGIPALAAAALLAVGAFFWKEPAPREISEGQLAALVDGWYKQAAPPQGWTEVDTATFERYPLDPTVARRPIRQRTMLIQGKAHGVAYDLTPPGRQRAILFVIRTQDNYHVGPLAYTKLPVTGGKAVGAWQKGNLLYVLAVVEGDGQRLSNFVRRHDLT